MVKKSILKQAVDIALQDLSKWWGLVPPPHVIRYEALPKGDLGIFEYCNDVPTITLSTRIRGIGRAYTTYLHEVGHLLGLEHTAAGIMAAHTGQTRYRWSVLNRQIWSGEIALRVAKKKKAKKRK